MEDERADDDVEDIEGVGQEKHHSTIGIEILLSLRQDGQVFPEDHEESSGDQRDGKYEAPFDHNNQICVSPAINKRRTIQT